MMDFRVFALITFLLAFLSVSASVPIRLSLLEVGNSSSALWKSPNLTLDKFRSPLFAPDAENAPSSTATALGAFVDNIATPTRLSSPRQDSSGSISAGTKSNATLPAGPVRAYASFGSAILGGMVKNIATSLGKTLVNGLKKIPDVLAKAGAVAVSTIGKVGATALAAAGKVASKVFSPVMKTAKDYGKYWFKEWFKLHWKYLGPIKKKLAQWMYIKSPEEALGRMSKAVPKEIMGKNDYDARKAAFEKAREVFKAEEAAGVARSKERKGEREWARDEANKERERARSRQWLEIAKKRDKERDERLKKEKEANGGTLKPL